jgi:hypothetical protein
VLGVARADAREPATMALVSESKGKWEGDGSIGGREGRGMEIECLNGGLKGRDASRV